MSELTNRLRMILDALAEGLVERDVAVRLALLAALAGEHLLLVGPPGTAKSLVARRLHLAFEGATYFERLLTRFSVPEELFGPLSIKGLQEDRYERLTESYLPTASIAFLDEIFKANSAILNALLTLLNEREFDNGARREKTPLVAVVGASNELPEGKELDALFDRFLLRLHVDPVSAGAFPALLCLKDGEAPVLPKKIHLTTGCLRAVRQGAESVAVHEDVIALLGDLRKLCIAEKIPVSDRRWRKIVKLLRTSAFSNGRDSVSIWDCWLLQHCLWSEADDRNKIYEWYAARVGAIAEKPSNIHMIVSVWEGEIQNDIHGKSQKLDGKGNPLYKAKNGEYVTAERGQNYKKKDPLYILPESARSERNYGRPEALSPDNEGKGYTLREIKELLPIYAGGRLKRSIIQKTEEVMPFALNESNYFMVDLTPALEPTKHKSVYIDDCIKQIQDHKSEAERHKEDIIQQIESCDADIRNHLWLTDNFASTASRNLNGIRADIDKIIARFAQVIAKYEKLPKENSASTRAGRSKPSGPGEGYASPGKSDLPNA